MKYAFAFALLSSAISTQAANMTLSPPALAPAFANADGHSTTETPEKWWQSFNDPILNDLIARALDQNMDIKMAATRVAAAESIRRAAKAAGRPELDLGITGARERVSGYTIGFSGPSTASQISGAFEASWEIDLFGRIRNDARAAAADASAASEDERAARIEVLFKLSRAYLTLRGLERSLEIAKSNQAAQEQTALYTRRLVEAGALPIADQHRADAQAATTSAAIPALELRRENMCQELAALLAMTSDAVGVLLDARHETSQAVTRLPAAGIPADLLRQRPDVRAAESRFRGALYRVGVAEADLKPRLVLSGFIGSLVGSFSGADLSRSVTWLAAATGTAPLFDGGRRRSVVALRKSEAQLAALAYQAAVLDAVKEVETSLASVSRDRENAQALGIAASEATHAAEQLRRAWRAGEIPMLDVLEADRARFISEAALAESETVERLDAAALFAALGGAERTSSDAR